MKNSLRWHFTYIYQSADGLYTEFSNSWDQYCLHKFHDNRLRFAENIFKKPYPDKRQEICIR